MNKSHGTSRELSVAQSLHMDAGQGNTEQRNEAYKWYVERVAEVLTQHCAISSAALIGSLSSRLSAAKAEQ